MKTKKDKEEKDCRSEIIFGKASVCVSGID